MPWDALGAAVTSGHVAAIDAGKFLDEIPPLTIQQLDGSAVDFSVERASAPRTTAEKLAQLKVLHPEIEGFSTTAGNSSGTNDACARRWLSSDRAYAPDKDLDVSWRRSSMAAVGVRRAHRTGRCRGDRQGARSAGLTPSDAALWEINEAFASVPIAACRKYGLDEELVNSPQRLRLGHPIAASGRRCAGPS